jgi:signal peptidase I
MSTRLTKSACLVAAVAALGAAWFFLAPPQLGGRTEYAITFGVSMEPHFHRGDLVVLRTRPSYGLGDVVAYRSHDLHRTVLHRIVGIHRGHYTFKGDNNGFVDPESPTAADLVGTEWLRIPRVGAWLADLRSPRNAAIAAGLVVLLLLATGGGGATAQRRRRRRTPTPSPERVPTAADGAQWIRIGVAATGAGTLATAAVLGLVAFTHPTQRTAADPAIYVQHGRFSYSTPVSRGGATYEDGRVRSGEPVYVQLVRRLPVAFSYRLASAQPERLSGTTSLEVVLQDDEGWRRRLVLAPRTPFDGSRAVVRGTLDLPRLRQMIAAFERQTGVHNVVYHVTLHAHVSVHGAVGSQPLATSYAPSLALNLDAYRLAPVHPTDATAPLNALSQRQAGPAARVEPATLDAFGRSVAVGGVRRLAEILGAAGLVLTLPAVALTLPGGEGQEVGAIRRRYEDWIVEVLPIERPTLQERRVASMEALARLAEQYDRRILHERREDGDAFLVEEDGIVYAYHVRNWDRHLAVAR